MILWLIEFLPYLWVVTVPVYGSFCGIDLILRISILLYIYIIAGEIVPKSMVRKAQSCNFTCSHVLMLTNDNLINLYLVIMQTNLKYLINSCRCNRCSFINCKCYSTCRCTWDIFPFKTYCLFQPVLFPSLFNDLKGKCICQ